MTYVRCASIAREYLRIGDEPNLNGVIDLVAGLLAGILDPTHEVARQALFNQFRRQCRIQHHR